MPNRDFPDSYYAASAAPIDEFAPLAGDERHDVCVIGGGITGCSTALHLAERGFKVSLIESNRIGWGASGRSGGQMIFGYACDMAKLKSLVGREAARALWDIANDAVALTKNLISNHGIDCDLAVGHAHAAIKPRQVRELELWRDELQRDYEYPTELITSAAVHEHIDSQRYLALLRDGNSGHLHPLNYTRGLCRAAVKAGVTVHESTPATAIGAGAVATISTPDGQIRADHVVCCGNAYLNDVAPEIASKIMPVGTYILATECMSPEQAAATLPTNMAIADMNFVLDYFRLSADHRMLFGGRVSYSTVQPPNLAAAMRRRMLKVFPQLATVPTGFVWGGNVGITVNRAPHFGRVRDNIYFAQGFSGHGIALTGMAGKLMADAIAGTAERFDVMARIPHRSFPGGRALRTPALVLAMAYYRLRDLL